MNKFFNKYGSNYRANKTNFPSSFLWVLFLVTGLSGLGLPVFSQVEVITIPEFVSEDGRNERLSEFSISVVGDAFADASPTNPVYMEVTLPQNVVLSRSLVEPGGSPIYLAVHQRTEINQYPFVTPNGIVPNFQVTAPKTAVAIVRYVAGESSVWLRINESSSLWISVDGDKQAPSFDKPVEFRFGMEGSASWSYTTSLFEFGLSNLPANTASPNLSVGQIIGDSTETFVDLTGAIFGEGSLLETTLSAFNAATGVETSSTSAGIIRNGVIPNLLPPSVFVGIVLPRSLGSANLWVHGVPLSLNNLGECEQVGDATVSIGTETFPNVTPTNPVYLRMNLSSNARLCQTLVNPNDAQSEPIYLALQLPQHLSGTVTAPADALAIVRWIEGETAIWLKITTPTNSWVNTGNQFSGLPIALEFTLGQTESESELYNQAAFLEGRSNLPANTRNLTTQAAVSTDLKLDLSSASVSAFSPSLQAYFRSFENSQGVETQTNPSEIIFGSSLGYEDWGVLGTYQESPVNNTSILLTSAARELQPGGSCETSGNLTLTLSSDIFPDLIPDSPLYLQLGLPQDVTLCETLVDPSNSDPLLLALRLDGVSSEDRLIAPPNAVSLVRWVAGENSIWIKFSVSTSQWIATPQGISGPTETKPVAFSIGLDAEATTQQNATLFGEEMANIPGNMRRSQLQQSSFRAASSLIKVDISDAAMIPNVQTNGTWRAYVSVDPSLWQFLPNIETEPDFANVIPGVDLPFSFPGLRDIGFTQTVAVNPPVAVQGLQVLTMEAVVAADVNPVEFKWINSDDNTVIGNLPSIVFDPVPTGTVKVRLEMKDYLGRVSASEGTLIVNSNMYDLNQDGVSDIKDLYFALPDWRKSHNILFLLSIPLQ